MSDRIGFDLYLAKVTGAPQNTLYPIRMKIENEAGLAVACCKDHVSAEFKDFRRSTEGFISSNVILGDCDNDGSDDPQEWTAPEDVAKALPGVAFYAVPSRHCMKVKHQGEPGEKSARPRWHYYWPIYQSINDPTQFSDIQRRILEVLPSFDPGGMKPAQFFFGTSDPQPVYFPGDLDIAEYFRNHPREEKKQTAPLARIRATDADKNIDDLLRYISADCDHDTWIKVGMAIKDEGLPFSTWDDWSRTAPSRYPGEKVIAKVWDSFKKTGIGFGTVVHLARQGGWTGEVKRPQKITGEILQGDGLQYVEAPFMPGESKTHNPAVFEMVRQLCAAAGWRGEISYYADAADGMIFQIKELENATPALVLIRSTDSVKTGWKDMSELKGVILPNDGERVPKKPHVSKKRAAIAATVADQVRDFDGVQIEEAKFLYYPWFLRGKITSLQGDSGCGKSTFLYSIGAAVSTGSPLLGVQCEDPGNVLFVSNEDSESDILTSFLDAGGDRKKLRRMSRDLISRLDLSLDGIMILDEVIKQNDIRFLCLDPIQAFLTGDMNSANATRPQLARLIDLVEKHQICLVIVQHLGKDISKSALHRAVGSVDIGAATRSMLQVVTDPRDQNFRIVFSAKNNSAPASEASKGIRYTIRSRAETMAERRHFHGYAVLTDLLPFYDERQYRRELKRADESAEREERRQVEYDQDPLILTVRKLIACNPSGLFIGFSDLIQRITEVAGSCPYNQDKSSITGLAPRIRFVREEAMRVDHIQMDLGPNNVKARPYNWGGSIVTPDVIRERGVYLRPVTMPNRMTDGQQTEL